MTTPAKKRNAFIGVHQGQADQVDDKLLPLGAVLAARNCWYDKDGLLVKRKGYIEVGATGPVNLSSAPDNWALANYKENVVWLSGSGQENPIYQWLDTEDVWATAYGGSGTESDRPLRSTSKANIRARRETVSAGDVDYVGVPHTAYAEGLTCIVFESSSTTSLFRVVIIDQETGAVLVNNEYTGSTPKVFAVEDTATAAKSFAVLYGDFALTTLKVIRWLVTGNAWTDGDPTVAATSLDTNFTDSGHRNWDAQMTYGSDLYVQVAWQKAGAATTTVQCALYYVSSGTDTLDTPSDIAAEADQCMNWLDDKGASGKYLLGTAGGTAGVEVQVMTLSGTFSLDAARVADATATANVRNITGFTTNSNSNGYHKVLWEVADTTNDYDDAIWFAEYSSTPTSAQTWILSANLQSKVFWLTGPDSDVNPYFLFGYDSDVQGTTFVGWLSPDNENNPQVRSPQCKIFPLSGGEATTKVGGIGVPANIGSYSFAVGLRRKARIDQVASTTNINASLERVTLNFHTLTEQGQPKEIGEWLIAPGGCMRFFDGIHYSPWPFDLRPEAPTLAGSTGAGALNNNGVYRYQIVYKMFDAQGRLHRSHPSAEAVVTLGGADNVCTVTCPTLRITHDESDLGRKVTIEVYRTEASGTLKHLVGTVANAPDSNTTDFTDLIADSALTSGEFIYSDGALGNLAPPGFTDVVEWQGHIVGIEAETPSAVWVSKNIVIGQAPGFSESLVIDLKSDKATALAVLDDRLFILSKNNVYVVLGDPQDDTGGGGAPYPQKVATRGTQYPRSVLVHDGVWFHSDGDICRLNRGMGIESFDNSDNINTTGYEPRGALFVPSLGHLRFYYSNGSAVQCACLSADYGGWTEMSINKGARGVSTYSGLPVFANNLNLYREAGDVESVNKYEDDGTGYSMSVQFPWFAVNQKMGEIRIHEFYPVANLVADVLFQANLNYDLEGSTQEETLEVHTSGISGLGTGVPLPVGGMPKRTKCHAFAIRFYESALSGTETAGFSLSGVMLVYSMRNETPELPNANYMTVQGGGGGGGG